ncbi:hypothetical protein ERJ75_000836000 [Trypanosoma vivax]|uniref:EF-hand domain-containing protein n=1 Tax=Trypanosoma vivax (strain Y486) TaxID=1055687 RepID=G0TYW3_TRYVY|nr:hypothetical protein TRVL_01702 [Trypanosoma vivax]KAH8613129.1 hypothetical protein ERJ75_000836000 [Trypanosoma vivax]CCC49166.1 conserved hypothetical protein [Trypanosoma vivax Y486]
METLINKAVERLGRKKVWLIVHVVRKLAPENRTAAGVRDAMRQLRFYLSDEDFAALIAEFCPQGDRTGPTTMESIPFDIMTFQRAFLLSLSPRRRHVVSLVLRKVGLEDFGFVDFNSLLQAYDVLRHPSVLTGGDADAVQRVFINDFAEAREDNGVTCEELAAYLVGISHAIPRDEDFELRCIRSFSLDRPKRSIEDLEAAAGEVPRKSNIPALRGITSHPLYQTSASDYGKDCDKVKYDPRYACNYSFTKSIQRRPSGGATTMNM